MLASPLVFPEDGTSPAEDPWRFDLDLDMAEVSWFFYDGNNRARASRIKKERQNRWEEWERLEVLKKKEKDDDVLGKKKEEDDKEKEQKQTEAVEADFKRARTCSLRRLRRIQSWPD